MVSEIRNLLVATNNTGKIKELTDFLSDSNYRLFGLAEFPGILEVDETGSTFNENAILKASGYSLQTGITSIADDSGLEVAALDNRPGVFSARYGGVDATYNEKMAKLIGELNKTGDRERRAQFVCSIAVANRLGEILISSEGICRGKIALNPSGSGGFGYDPLFIPDGFDHSLGVLSISVKRSISHRSMAINQIIPFLRDYDAL